MVEPVDARATAEVVALVQALDAIHVVEVLDHEPERVLHAHRLADAARRAGGDAPGGAAPVAVEPLGPIEIRRRADAQGEAGARRRRAGAQHERVVHELLVPA